MTRKKTSTPETRKEAGAQGKASAAVEPLSGSELQLKSFEIAVQLFSQRKLAEARDRFTEAAKGPAAHVSDKARAYIQICDRKTARVEVQVLTAEEHFNHGVERLNARDVERARHHLDRALQLDPDADHILYIMALCCGLAGDGAGACENLRRAIDLEPRNRILARQDPEFLSLASQFPALRTLLEHGPY